MRKIVKVWLCSLAAAAVIAGCSKKPAEENEAAQAASTEALEQEAAAETLPMVDLSEIDNGTITLGEYKGIEVTKIPTEVTDEEIDKAIEADLQAHGEYMEVERPVESGDKVNIDYVGTKDGVAFEGGTAQGYDLVIGSGQFIDGFEDGLIGAKKGDKVTLNLTFPENYGKAELAGQPVVFEVTVQAVKEKQIPVLNDAFVKEVSDFETVEEYRDDKMQALLVQKSSQADMQVENDLLRAILDASDIQVNEEAVEANYNNVIANYTNQAAAYGMDLAAFAGFYGMSEDEFKEELKSQSKNVVEQRLVFDAIAEKEGLSVSDEDRESLAKEMGYESADKLIEAVGKFAVDNYVISTKAMKVMVDHAVIK